MDSTQVTQVLTYGLILALGALVLWMLVHRSDPNKTFQPHDLGEVKIHEDRARRLRRWKQLTVREKEVANLARHAATHAEIAQALDITPRTVDAHLRKIYPKLGVTNKIELASKYQDIGDDQDETQDTE